MEKVINTEKTDQTKVERYNVFTIAGNKNRGYIIALGQYQVAENVFKSVKAAKEYIDSKPYDIIINAINAVQLINKQLEK